MDHWEFTKRAGTLVGLAGAVVALSWFCFSTISRINTLEAQIQALVVTRPANDFQPYATQAPSQSESSSSSSKVELNPLALVCANLASKIYEKYKDKGGVPALDPGLAVMDQLGCKKLK